MLPAWKDQRDDEMPASIALPAAELHDEILQAVADGFARQLDLTKDLVRQASTRGSEAGAQDLMEQALRARGYAVDRWQLDPAAIAAHPGASPVDVSYAQASNVVGTLEPEGAATGRSLLINGHVDVVPTGPVDMWQAPPFDPRVEGGWLYGRGAGDMKAGLVAALAAIDALAATGYRPAARLHLASVVEEESTGNGALACHQRGYRGDAALIPEPTGEALVRANLGVVWFTVETRGKPAHVHESRSGANAIKAMRRIIRALENVEVLWNASRRLDPWFRDHPHPISINIGRIEGGDWASSVPSWCRLHVRAGFYPSVAPQDALAEITRAIGEAVRRDPVLSSNPPVITCNGFHVRGYALVPGSEAEATLRQVHEGVFGEKLRAIPFPAYLDARVMALYDRVPALVYGPVAHAIHGVDEAVDLASLKRVTGAIALFIAGWCGLQPTGRPTP